MDRRAFLRTVGGAAAGLALGACSGGGGGSGTATRAAGGGRAGAGARTVRIAGGTFGFPSPFGYVAGPGYREMTLVYDTLLWTDSTGELLPWLASAHERSSDGLTHTFDLRDARWSDGRPLRARDVVFTFEYFAAHVLPPLVIGQPRNVAKVVEVGERRVAITLDRPVVTFAKSVAGTVPIVPEHVWSSIDDPAQAFDDEVLVSTGPYRLASRSPEEGTALYVANDKYFLGPPHVGRIESVSVGDELSAVLAGDLDGGSPPVEGVASDALAPFRRDPDTYGLVESPTGFAFPMYFNLGRGGALADLRFRRACAHAIDRGDIVRRLLKGNGEPGSAGFLPPGHPFHVDVEPYPHDLAAANRLLDQAGYRRSGSGGGRQGPDGSPLRFKLLVPNTVPPALIDVVVAGLKEAGIEATPEVVDLVRLFGIKGSGNFDMLITLFPGPVGVGPNGDPEILRNLYYSKSGGQNFHAAAGYVNPTVDDLLDRQLVTFDQGERKEIVAEVQRAVARDLPVLPLYYTTLFFAYRRKAFDQWYFTKGGFGPGIPTVYNKHAFVTGAKRGLEVRR